MGFLFIFVMLTKCCVFAIKTELWLLSKLFISSVSGEYRNFFERTFGFLSFSVIVTLVDSRDGLVEPLLWSFVIAPLLSYCLNFCKGTITVIVLKSEYRCNAVFAVWVTSVVIKNVQNQIKFMFRVSVSVNLSVMMNDSCYWKKKLFLSLFLFQSFLCFGVTK